MQVIVATAKAPTSLDSYEALHPPVCELSPLDLETGARTSIRVVGFLSDGHGEWENLGYSSPGLAEEQALWHPAVFSAVLQRTGLVADAPEGPEAPLTESVRIAQDVKARHIKLRHRGQFPVFWPAKTDEATPERDVFPEAEVNMRCLSTKMRTNVCRSLKSGCEVEFGRREFLAISIGGFV
jgi:hypothetical protein